MCAGVPHGLLDLALGETPSLRLLHHRVLCRQVRSAEAQIIRQFVVGVAIVHEQQWTFIPVPRLFEHF